MRARTLGVILCLVVLLLVGCTSAGQSAGVAAPVAAAPTEPPLAAPAASAAIAATPTVPCPPGPFIAPTPPAVIPGYTEQDPATSLHVTGEMQLIDPTTYRLRVTGQVDRPLELTLDEIRCQPYTQTTAVLVCPGFFEDTATWGGTPLKGLLERAGLQDGAQRIRIVSADGYKTSLPLEDALNPEALLAYTWEGEPLPRLHGFPARLVLPGLTGGLWAKWVVEIQVE